MRTAFAITCFTCFCILFLAACESAPTGGLPGEGQTGGDGAAEPAQFLPSAITLEIDELPDGDDSSAKTTNAAVAVGTTAYAKTVQAGAEVLNAFQQLADDALEIAAEMQNDITDLTATTISGTLTVDGTSVDYKADLASFDFDGDGDADGTGLATQDPVALRMWVDNGTGYQRFLCALITTRPTGTNIGAGGMYAKPVVADASFFDDLLFFVQWDRTNSDHKWNEAYVGGHVRSNMSMTIGRQRVDVRTNADGTVEKTVRSTSQFSENQWGFDGYSFAGVYAVGGESALISGQSDGGIFEVSFEDVCVSLDDASALNASSCSDFDTQDMTFLDDPIGTETDWPAAFPQSPTF